MCERHNKDGLHPADPEGWVDIGCANFVQARRNRKRIGLGLSPLLPDTPYWKWLELVLSKVAFGHLLPPNVPIGNLPEVGRRDYTPSYTFEDEKETE